MTIAELAARDAAECDRVRQWAITETERELALARQRRARTVNLERHLTALRGAA